MLVTGGKVRARARNLPPARFDDAPEYFPKVPVSVADIVEHADKPSSSRQRFTHSMAGVGSDPRGVSQIRLGESFAGFASERCGGGELRHCR